jgi:hypothetical protein
MNKREKKRKYIVEERRRLHQMKHPQEEVDPNSRIEDGEIIDEEDVEDNLSGYSEALQYRQIVRRKGGGFNFREIEPDLRNMII